MRETKANKNYPLLRELRRWQPRKRERARSVRWAAMAESLQERYGRTAVRQAALPLLLAKPITLVTRIERWQRTALRFYPKVNLAIGPILLRLESGQTPSALVLHRLTTLTRSVTLLNRESIAGGRLRSSKPSSEPSVRGHGPDVRSSPAYSSNTPQLESRESLMQTPLMKVFARAGAEARGDGSSSSHYETALVRRSLLLAGRIADERQRIEASQRRDLFTQEQRELPMLVNRPVRQEAVFESPEAMRAAALATMPSIATSSLDIESLTDQVVRSLDNRLVAHRERLGKVF